MISGILCLILAAINLQGVINGNLLSLGAFAWCCIMSGFCFGISAK